jgi:hypothetical protein
MLSFPVTQAPGSRAPLGDRAALPVSRQSNRLLAILVRSEGEVVQQPDQRP